MDWSHRSPSFPSSFCVSPASLASLLPHPTAHNAAGPCVLFVFLLILFLLFISSSCCFSFACSFCFYSWSVFCTPPVAPSLVFLLHLLLMRPLLLSLFFVLLFLILLIVLVSTNSSCSCTCSIFTCFVCFYSWSIPDFHGFNFFLIVLFVSLLLLLFFTFGSPLPPTPLASFVASAPPRVKVWPL